MISKNKFFQTLLCLGLFSLTFQASAAPFNFLGSGGSNVDGASPTTFDILATGPGLITDLNISLHLYNSRPNVLFPGTMAWGDLNVTLSKDGVDVLLWGPDNPGETSDLFVVLDDESTESLSLNDLLSAGGISPVPTLAPQAFASGVAAPVDPDNVAASYNAVGSLSSFDSLALAGLWRLTIFDPIVPGEGDNLLGWQIFGTTDASTIPPVPVPAAVWLFGTALVGLAGFARRRKTV